MCYAVWLPDFDSVGLNIKINSFGLFGPFNGIILGPYWGAAVSLSIGILHQIIFDPGNGNTFAMVTPLFLMLSSLIAGLILIVIPRSSAAVGTNRSI